MALEVILNGVGAKCGELPTVLFADAGFCEILKWRGGTEAPSDVLVLSLSMLDCGGDELGINSWMKRFNPLRGIFLVSTPLRDAMWVIKRQCELFNFIDCIVLTSSTTASTVLPDEEAELEEPYAFAKRVLRPTKSTVLYFPFHSLPIIPATRQKDATPELLVLSSPPLRDFFPLTLNMAGQYPPPHHPRSATASVRELEAAQLPRAAKVNIRSLSHELAGALAHDVGVVVPESHIFTLGHTATFVGHSVQPLVAGLGKQLEQLGDLEREGPGRLDAVDAILLAEAVRRGAGAGDGPSPSLAPLPRASLLVIDRTEDLSSPAAHGPCPLAHRVLSTLARARDVWFRGPDRSEGQEATEGEPETESDDWEWDKDQDRERGHDDGGRGGNGPNAGHRRGSGAFPASPTRPRPCAYQQCDVRVWSSKAEQQLGSSHPPPRLAAVLQDQQQQQQNSLSLSQQSRPLGALSGLPLDLAPSLCLPRLPHTLLPTAARVKATAANAEAEIARAELEELHRCLFFGSEDTARALMVRALTSAIARKGGQPPPAKRRGLGAEVLAYMQALVAAAKAEQERRRGDTLKAGVGAGSGLCLRERELLALCAAVVEAMQRSVSRAPAPPAAAAGGLPSWQCGFETRSARERAVDAILQAPLATFAEVVPLLLSFLGGPPPSKTAGTKGAAGAGGVGEDPCNGPPDVAHLLLLVVRTLAITGLQPRLLAAATVPHQMLEQQHLPWAASLRQELHRFLWAVARWLGGSSASEGELLSLTGLGLLPKGFAEDWAECRRLGSDEGQGGHVRGSPAKSNGGSGADEWDDSWGDDGDGNARGQAEAETEPAEAQRRLELQLSDVVSLWLPRLLEVAETLRSASCCDGEGRPFAAFDMLGALRRGDGNALEGGAGGAGGAVGAPGVLALTVRQLLAAHHSERQQLQLGHGAYSSPPPPLPPLDGYIRVESALQQLKRAGLGLLSQGLSFFGSGLGAAVGAAPNEPHPCDHSVLVLFVVGGLSLREARQVQYELETCPSPGLRVILASNALLDGEGLLRGLMGEGGDV